VDNERAIVVCNVNYEMATVSLIFIPSILYLMISRYDELFLVICYYFLDVDYPIVSYNSKHGDLTDKDVKGSFECAILLYYIILFFEIMFRWDGLENLTQN
jgi:Mg2+/citrate symporter